MRRLRTRSVAVAAATAAGACVLATAAAALTPSDPDATHPAYAALNLPAAWDMTTGAPEIVIAIVDSGVDPAHPDLAGAVLQGYDFVDDDTDPSPADGHGTGVAGTAAARANNGIGGVGACFTCSVMPLQVVGPDGIALNLDIAEAIDYAVDHGAAVVNVSLIGPNSPPGARARDRASTCCRRVRRGRGRQRRNRHAPVPRRGSRDHLGRSFHVRRKAGELLQPWNVGEVRCARVRADRRARRWLRRRLRHVDVVAARRRDRRAHAHPGPLCASRRDRGSAGAYRPRSAWNAIRSPRRRRRVASAREHPSAAACGRASAASPCSEPSSKPSVVSGWAPAGDRASSGSAAATGTARRSREGLARGTAHSQRRRAPAAGRGHGGGGRRGSIRADAVRRDQAAVRDAAGDRRDAPRRHAAASRSEDVGKEPTPFEVYWQRCRRAASGSRVATTTACVAATRIGEDRGDRVQLGRSGQGRRQGHARVR